MFREWQIVETWLKAFLKGLGLKFEEELHFSLLGQWISKNVLKNLKAQKDFP